MSSVNHGIICKETMTVEEVFKADSEKSARKVQDELIKYNYEKAENAKKHCDGLVKKTV